MRHRCAFAVSMTLALISSLPSIAATATDIAPRGGPIGARVMVAGTGLDDPGVSVSFSSGSGRVTAVTLLRTASLLEVSVPRGATSGELRVATLSTTVASFAFTVIPLRRSSRAVRSQAPRPIMTR